MRLQADITWTAALAAVVLAAAPGLVVSDPSIDGAAGVERAVLSGPGAAAPPAPEVWRPAVARGQWSFGSADFVYTSRASGNADLWLKTGPLGESTRLTDHPAQDHWASWFPDGDRVAFQTLRDGNREVYVMNTDGSGVTNLTHDEAQDLLPEVSPDGRRIAFFSDRGLDHGPRELPGHLYLMDADGSGVERLTDAPLSSTFFAAWSPDGLTLASARSFDGNVDIVLIDVDSGAERRVAGTEASEYGARFSPDGAWLAFHAAGEGDEARIVVARVDGSERRELTAGGQHYDPRWSPDGRWLMFTGAASGAAQFDLMMVSAQGGSPRPLVATDADERTGSWRPQR
jgi:TolB protein